MPTRLCRKGCCLIRETQSMAFLRPPGMEKLYSGVAMMTPSATRIRPMKSRADGGMPLVILVVAIVDRQAVEGGDLERHARGSMALMVSSRRVL